MAFGGHHIINSLGTFFCAGNGETQRIKLFDCGDANDAADEGRSAGKNGNFISIDDLGNGIGFGRIGGIDDLSTSKDRQQDSDGQAERMERRKEADEAVGMLKLDGFENIFHIRNQVLMGEGDSLGKCFRATCK